jgi:hypothetical protein
MQVSKFPKVKKKLKLYHYTSGIQPGVREDILGGM